VPGGIPGVAVAAVVIITRSLSARADIGLGEGILERCRVGERQEQGENRK